MIVDKNQKGEIYRLPIQALKENVAFILSEFSIESQVDILCALEFTLIDRQRRNSPHYLDEVAIYLYFEYLDSMRSSPAFAKHLEMLGFKSSLDRVRYGQKIAL